MRFQSVIWHEQEHSERRLHIGSRLQGCCEPSAIPRRAALNWGGSRGAAAEPCAIRPVAQSLEPAAHNGLVGGSNPPGPTTQSCATGDFLKVYERPRIGGDRCDRSFTETARYSRQVVSAHFSLAPKSRFPETETARRRDSVRMPVTAGDTPDPRVYTVLQRRHRDLMF